MAGEGEDGAPEFEVIAAPRGAELASHMEAAMDHWAATQHMMSNLSIEVDGDVGRSSNYLSAAHVPRAERPDEHCGAGGTYRNEYRRIDEV
jgi:hypothetical protein